MARLPGEYDAVAKLLHWLIAAFVLGLIGLGLTMTRTGGLALKFELYQLHKSMGITVLMLMVLRIAWRLFLPPAGHAGLGTGCRQGHASPFLRDAARSAAVRLGNGLGDTAALQYSDRPL